MGGREEEEEGFEVLWGVGFWVLSGSPCEKKLLLSSPLLLLLSVSLSLSLSCLATRGFGWTGLTMQGEGPARASRHSSTGAEVPPTQPPSPILYT